MCDVATMMLISTGIGIAGGLVQMGSSVAAGAAQRKYNEKLAQSFEGQAGAIGDQAHWDILRLRGDIRQFTGSQRAAQAASGMAGSQSALEVLSDTERQAAMDTMTIQRNADLQRAQMIEQARLARVAGKNAYTAGWLGAGSSLIGTAGSVADIWSRWSQTSRGQTAYSSSQSYYRRSAYSDRGLQAR
jgi:hypothetical protein